MGTGTTTLTPSSGNINSTTSVALYGGSFSIVYFDGANFWAALIPIATTSQFGLVMPDGITVDVSSGIISVPTATTSLLGLSKPDGTTIDITAGGTISVPTATSSALGIVKPDNTTITISSGTLTAVTVSKVNGAAVPASAAVLGSNSSSQLIAASTTGSGTTAVLGTSPTFTTSITSPVVYGGSAASSTLTLDGTSNGTASNAYVLINPGGQGNVGIGTASPGAKLEVNGNLIVDGTGSFGSYAVIGTGVSGGYYQDSANGAYRSIIGTGSASGYYFQTNGGNATTLYVGLGGSYNGNVGIGTATPHSKLAVVGLPVYASNAAAIAGGLAAGDFYRTGADPDVVCVTH